MRCGVILLASIALCLANATDTPVMRTAIDFQQGIPDAQAAGVNYAAHETGRCAVFDGRGARMLLPSSDAWSVAASDSFTIRFSFRTTQHSEGTATLLSARAGGGERGWSFYLGFRRSTWGRVPGPFCMELWNGPDVFLPALHDVSDGQWHRVEAAYDGARRVAALALDGEIQGTMRVPGEAPAPPLQLCLGAEADGSDGFAGALDDVALAAGVSPEMRRLLELYSNTEILTRKEVDSNYDAWAERLYRVRPFPAQTPPEWTARRQAIREHVRRCLGLFPWPYTKDQPGDQLPLDVRLGEKRDYDDFSVQGVSWQSWEGLYGRGWLYLPKTGKPPYPAILNLNGHFRYEGRDPVEQSRCMALAKLGYIALEVNSEHPENLAAGITPLSGMVWNDLRGLHYLLSRPDVDRARVGCTGASGGGQQTYYLMCLDDRIQAAVPVALPTFFKELSIDSERKPWRTGTHCNCNYVCDLLPETDCPEMCAVFAPRPALFISNQQDWTRMWPEEGHPEVMSIYRLYGAEEALELFHDSRPHGYPRPWREAMYAFFNRRFMGLDDPNRAREPENLPILPVEEMDALLPAAPRATDWTPAMTREFSARENNQSDTMMGRERLKELVSYDDAPGFQPSTAVVRETRYGQWRMRLQRYRTEPDIEVPALLLSPARGKGPRPLAVVVGEAGKANTLLRERALCTGLLSRGWAVLLPDVRYTGELPAAEAWYKAFGTLTGRTQTAAQVHDLENLLQAALRTEEYDRRHVTVIGLGDAAVPALILGALDERVTAVAGDQAGPPYASGRRRPYCDRILQAGDLPGVRALLASRPLYWSETANREALLAWCRELPR